MDPTLLVLAAGMGSRYGGVKQIDSVGANCETLLDFSVFDAKKAGYGKVVFIIRKDIEQDFRERLFDRIAKNMDAEYVFQNLDSLLTPEQTKKSEGRTKPWGTVHALLCASEAVKEPFTVINADDYYGRSPYYTLGTYLSGLSNDSTAHAMVGYRLENTMSRVGSVSRGVCRVEGENLVTMVENTKIEYADGDKIVSHTPEGDLFLSGNEIVSMNFFGFAPCAFDYFRGYWDSFIKEHCAETKGECLLPNAVGLMVGEGKGTVKVFDTGEKWFGMTYKEDKQIVRDSLAEKVASGFYPAKLWEKE